MTDYYHKKEEFRLEYLLYLLHLFLPLIGFATELTDILCQDISIHLFYQSFDLQCKSDKWFSLSNVTLG